MTPSQLELIGQKLYGPQWQSPLARALGIDLTTLTNYKAGKSRIPRPVGHACEHLLANPEKALNLGLAPKTKRDRKICP